MRNLLEETIEYMACRDKYPSDVKIVYLTNSKNTKTCFTWDDFAEICADIEYDEDYGGAEINETLEIVGKDWWLERHEYDGDEWWEFKTLPNYPNSIVTKPGKKDIHKGD